MRHACVRTLQDGAREIKLYAEKQIFKKIQIRSTVAFNTVGLQFTIASTEEMVVEPRGLFLGSFSNSLRGDKQ